MNTIQNEIEHMLSQEGVNLIRFVDLAPLYEEMTFDHIQRKEHTGRSDDIRADLHSPKLHIEPDAGSAAPVFPSAIVFGMALTPDFILSVHENLPVSDDEYLQKETKVELLAEKLALYIQNLGFRTYAQSEANNLRSGYFEQRYAFPEITCGISPIPQKAIARISGLGFIGKNNLLITKEYGCAVALCSVLTEAPFATSNYTIAEESCGSCSKCIDACPGTALYGEHWTVQRGRDFLLNVSKCCCPLRCMVSCPWTLHYAGLT